VRLREWFLRAETGRSRVLTAAATGAVVAFVVAWFAPWQLTILVGWDVMAVSTVATVALAHAATNSSTSRVVALTAATRRPISSSSVFGNGNGTPTSSGFVCCKTTLANSSVKSGLPAAVR